MGGDPGSIGAASAGRQAAPGPTTGHALRRTKFNLNRGADAPISTAMALEVPAAGFQEEGGVQSFVEKVEIWRQRRSTAQHFWQS